MQFIALIGSFARGDANERSDCDLFVVNSSAEVIGKIPGIPDGTVTNIVSLTEEAFLNLYHRGSLFLFHVFSEGKLLWGDEEMWLSLGGSFKFQRDYRREITRIHRVTERFWALEKFGGKYLWPLVNAFPLVKNASIFTLAQNGIYRFNKSQCLIDALRDDALIETTRCLVDFYDFAVKELPVILPFDPNDDFYARKALHAVAYAVREMMNDIAS